MINSATAAKLRAMHASPAELFEVIAWISTRDQMPEENRLVLASYGGGFTYIMLWNGVEWFNAEADHLVRKPRQVRYWSYLPHGPIDAKQETAQ